MVDTQKAKLGQGGHKAFDNDLVGGDGVKVFRRVDNLLQGNANARNRILSMDEFKKLMATLPAHTRAIVAMEFYPGMRRGEVLNLTWDPIDMRRRVIPLKALETKDREDRTIPIGDG